MHSRALTVAGAGRQHAAQAGAELACEASKEEGGHQHNDQGG